MTPRPATAVRMAPKRPAGHSLEEPLSKLAHTPCGRVSNQVGCRLEPSNDPVEALGLLQRVDVLSLPLAHAAIFALVDEAVVFLRRARGLLGDQLILVLLIVRQLLLLLLELLLQLLD